MNRILFLLLIPLVLGSCNKSLIGFRSEKSSYDIKAFDFEYLQMKSKLEIGYEGKDGTQSATASIRLRKDSIIWFNLSGTLGIQGLRGIFTQDSVKILNRVEKDYTSLSYQDFSDDFNFPVDFQILQSLLLGNPIFTEGGEAKTSGGKYFIEYTVNEIKIFNYINRDYKKLEELRLVEQPTSNSLDVQYSDFQDVQGQIFPMAGYVSLAYKDNTGSLETTIDIEHTKVDIPQKPLKFPFNVPNKYTK